MARPRRRFLVTALITVSVLLAASCGDDDDDDAATTAPPATEADGTTTTAAATDTTAAGTDTSAAGTDTTVAAEEGCGADAVTDPTLLDPDRPVARCPAGFPEPQPLPERETVRLSSSFRLEFNSPMLLADTLGEFDRENIDIEFITLPYSDAAPQLASGDIDVAVGGFEIALFNAGFNDLPIRAVLGNYFPPHAGDYSVPQTGLWCRRDAFSTPDDPDPAETQSMRWASSVGRGSAAVYYSITELMERVPDFNIDDLQVDIVPSADTVTALQNGAIDCGVILDPLWLQLAEDPAYVQMATQTPGEPLGQYSFGRRLLEDRRDIGEAVARAYIRTVNTYFSGDYHQDPEVMQAIADATELPLERLTQVDSLVMDWEIREGTTDRMQQLFIDLGVITDYDTPVPEEQIIDRSFYLAAVGAE
jgi:NitT/TauT family transport system substrate-binding protein